MITCCTIKICAAQQSASSSRAEKYVLYAKQVSATEIQKSVGRPFPADACILLDERNKVFSGLSLS
jgi:hypothetical protein